MNCTNCGAQLSDNAGFCPNCGSAVENSASAEIADGRKKLGRGKLFSGKKDKEMQFDPNAGKSKKKNTIIGIIVCVAVLALAAIIVSSIFYKPQIKLLRGLQKDIFKAKSISVKVTADGETAKAEIKWGKGIDDTEATFKADDSSLVIKNGKATVKGKQYVPVYDSYGYYDHNEIRDFEEEYELEELFEDLGEELSNYGFDFDPLKVIDGIINKRLDEKRLTDFIDGELSPALQDLAGEYDYDISVPKFKAVKKQLVKFFMSGLTKKALKFEHDGFNGYSYTLDVEEALDCLIKFVEKNKTIKDAIGEDMIDEFIEELEWLRDDAADSEATVKGSFKLSATGYLTHFDATPYVEDDKGDTVRIDIEVNK